MSIDSVIVPLLSASIFAGLEPAQLKVIAIIARHVVFDDGVDLVRDGEEGDAAYVIAGGTAVVNAIDPDDAEEPGEEIELGLGSVIGELAMFVDTVHETTVTARGEVHALRIERAQMLDAMELDQTLSERFLDVVRGRLEGTLGKLRSADQMLADSVPAEATPAASLH